MNRLKIVADMAGDLFHAGHVNFLRSARKYFNTEVNLTVALHTDVQILSYKKHYPVMNFECRKEVILSCIYVDSVIQAPDEFDRDFINQFDYLVHGDDILQWSSDLVDKFYAVVKTQNKLIMVPYTKGISTTQLRQNLISQIGTI